MSVVKRSVCIVVCVLLVSLISGCTQKGETVDESYRTVTDLDGNEITVPSVITNYAVAWSGDFDILAMLDNCEHMSAFPEQSLKFPMLLEIYPELNDRIRLPKINVSSESILESGAQVVFLRYSDYPELTEQLKKQNIPAVNINFENYDEVIRSVELVADVLNTDEARNKAKRYREYVENAMNEIQEMAASVDSEKASLIVFRDSVDYTAYSPDRMVGEWAKISGFNYLIDTGDSTANVNLTTEEILEYDPDYIMFAFPGNIDRMLEDEKFQSLTSVKNNHVYEAPTVLNPFPLNGAEVVMQLKWVYSVMWPEETDIDLKEEAKSFYKEFYNLEFSDERWDEILYGAQR